MKVISFRKEEGTRSMYGISMLHWFATARRRRADMVAAAVGDGAAQAIDERCYPLFKLRAFTVQAWVT